MIFDNDEEFEEKIQEFTQKIISRFNSIFHKNPYKFENGLYFQIIEDFAKYINENEVNNKLLIEINKFFNEETYSEYDFISYLIYSYFIKKLNNEKINIINNISTGIFKNIIIKYCENKDILEFKYMINNILAEWDPIGVPFSIKFDEYANYIEPIFLLGNNEIELEKYLIYLIDDYIGLGFDKNNESQKEDIHKVVSKIIALYKNTHFA
jgi:hypothetical protein